VTRQLGVVLRPRLKSGAHDSGFVAVVEFAGRCIEFALCSDPRECQQANAAH